MFTGENMRYWISIVITLLLTGCEKNVPSPYGTQPQPLEVGKHPGQNGKLTPKEREMAKIAWKYFENNYQKDTGLVNAVDNYPSTTMWDTASYLGALTAANELGIIDAGEFNTRLSKILATLNRLKLFRNGLPNKVYHTQTMQKVNYGNQPGEIGVSALDLGRMLTTLKIVKERYVQYASAIDNFVARWNFTELIDEEGTLYGAYVDEHGKSVKVQEGRLGYEEYAAKGFQLWGFNTGKASLAEPYSVVPINDELIPYDNRDPRSLGAHNYVVSESYVLDGIEFNWDLADDKSNDDMQHSHPWMSEFAQRIYNVQQRRYETTGIITARTEHQLDKDPYFVYDTIFTDGYPWNTIDEKGKRYPQYAAVAVKGAIGLWALWKTPYTDILFDSISGLYDVKKGFYEGLYENGKGVIPQFTANNNGIILEALLYKEQGKLMRFSNRSSLWDKILADPFKGQGKGLPGKSREAK